MAMALLCVLATTTSVRARLGEPQAAIERRLLAPGVGKLMALDDAGDARGTRPNNNNKNFGERAETPRRRAAEAPFRRHLNLFPGEIRERAYWKSAVTGQLNPDDGWEVHVLFLGDRSTLEAYRRVGGALNEFETMALLSLNRGASSWRRVDKDTATKTVLGYAFELEDGSLRALRQGDWFLIYSTRLDEYALQRQAEDEAVKAIEQERLKRQQQAKAPESVAGF